MRLESVFVVLKREYLQRVKNKAFWIATLIVPLFSTAVTTLPGLLMAGSHTSQTLVVVDDSGQGIADALKAELARAKTAEPNRGTQAEGAQDDGRMADVA